ncbi:hypothetical protein GCM10010984_20600 [Chishuiella changwenlii]|uniref:Leucine-binding protein domain-containing protein n=2 Tax=Chishuiella changwenlii TaxID=1434701 RepID=A0ABQ1TTX6_9FLAO|nr:ABC transporter substrate-binding protein [Chishuiella changwenlii]GGF03042.1 hypothetical protein GCM10010984_20600 [Chishuiella changwenlii]
MNKKLKIGFLMPFSAVYPHYGLHLTAGIFTAFQYFGVQQKDVEIVPAFIAQGQHKLITEAVQKLVFFDGVDVVIGMVNIKSLPEISAILETYNKLGLFIDFGELVHPTTNFGTNIGCLSMNYWQSEYVLGQWAAKEFGSDGQVVLPLFEAGYNLHYTFLQGAGKGGSEALHQMVLPQEYATKEHLNLTPFFEAIEEDEPNYVHAIFNGSLGTQFFNQWKQSKFYNHIPLIVVENMAYEDILQDVQHLDLNFYSAASWKRENQLVTNQKFVQSFEQMHHQPVSVFSMLGYELGLTLGQAYQDLVKGDTKTVIQKIKQSTIEGPRGRIAIEGFTEGICPMIDIYKVKTNHQKITNTILEQDTAIGFDTTSVFEETESGFLNPYFSI